MEGVTVAVRGRAIGTMSHLEKATSGGKGGGIRFLQDGDGVTVRFLVEPEKIYEFLSHYDQERRVGIPCDDGDCIGCNDTHRYGKPSRKFLVPAVDITSDPPVVSVFQIPVSLLAQLKEFYEKYGTLCDRDYELRRKGKTMEDTKYFAIPDRRYRLKTERFKPPDKSGNWVRYMESLVEALIPRDEEAAVEDDEPPFTKRQRRKPGSRTRDSRYYEDDEDDEDEPPRRPVRVVRSPKPKVTSRTGRSSTKNKRRY